MVAAISKQQLVQPVWPVHRVRHRQEQERRALRQEQHREQHERLHQQEQQRHHQQPLTTFELQVTEQVQQSS
jgi:hypothetical protein